MTNPKYMNDDSVRNQMRSDKRKGDKRGVNKHRKVIKVSPGPKGQDTEPKSKKYSPIGVLIKNSDKYFQKIIEYPVVVVHHFEEKRIEVIQPWERVTTGPVSNVPTVKWDRVMGLDGFYAPNHTEVPIILKENFIGEITELKLLSDGGICVREDFEGEGDLCYGVAEIIEWIPKT